MNARQFAALEEKVSEWIAESCEESDWPKVIVGERTSELMAVAARAVFDACEESQQYASCEGYMTLGVAQSVAK